ncbi:MAG: hypothetical protein V3R66_06690 [Rhodospirillales bacterium]
MSEISANESPTGLERRMVHRLLIHWREALGEEKTLPSLDDVMGRDLGDIAPLIYVLNLPEGGEPEFASLGEAFSGSEYGDLAGKPLSAVPEGTLLKNALGYYKNILDKKVPITMGGDFTDSQGKTVFYRSIIVPLSGGGDEIGQLLGAANFKNKED